MYDEPDLTHQELDYPHAPWQEEVGRGEGRGYIVRLGFFLGGVLEGLAQVQEERAEEPVRLIRVCCSSFRDLGLRRIQREGALAKDLRSRGVGDTLWSVNTACSMPNRRGVASKPINRTATNKPLRGDQGM